MPPLMVPSAVMAHELAVLLLSPKVQSIDFRFGHVPVMPAGYRLVAEALFAGRITILVDPDALKKHDLPGGPPLGMYQPRKNRITVPKYDMLSDPEDRVTLFHEATHAIQDRQHQVISNVQDEGAAQVAEIWYRLEAGISMAPKNSTIVEIGSAMYARRGTESPVVATNSEIYRMNQVVRKVGGIADTVSVGDGF